MSFSRKNRPERNTFVPRAAMSPSVNKCHTINSIAPSIKVTVKTQVNIRHIQSYIEDGSQNKQQRLARQDEYMLTVLAVGAA